MNLDRAMEMYKAEHPHVQFEVTWTPFNLDPKAKVSAEHPRSRSNQADNNNPNFPKPKACEKKEYLLNQLGPAGAQAFRARVEAEAAALGVKVNWEGRCGNTRDSHILLLLAARRRQQQQQRGHHRRAATAPGPPPVFQELLGALCRGVFEEGMDVSDRCFLVKTAVRVGLRAESSRGCDDEGDMEGEKDGETRREDGEAEEALLRWLDSDEARAEADALDKYAKEVAGIAAVPSYIVQGRYRVGGKQDPEVFLRLFERLESAAVNGE
ncbi:hypothetical protein VPNG_04469 [Cytospora leucostoma]|uniref:DSBA-like thioredoxin domain-containing protein n=1 Tax=Cytospora leucostoma TaxID=1230097 RepID=A0A423XBZ0_9PEZI|nr:hypothetical protein VPNG_04469 [Cytospora leucostoma]